MTAFFKVETSTWLWMNLYKKKYTCKLNTNADRNISEYMIYVGHVILGDKEKQCSNLT